jgi:hypothetical protein
MIKAETRAYGFKFAGIVVVGLALGASITPSSAIGTEDQRAACTPDVFRLCSSEIPSVDRIVACLQREKPHLSDGCRAVFSSPAKTETAHKSRSLGPPVAGSEWCVFPDGTPQPGLELWKSWCASTSAKP